MQNLRVATWNSVGYDVSKAQDLGQVLQTSGLDYDVMKMPLALAGDSNTTGKIVDFIRMVHAA